MISPQRIYTIVGAWLTIVTVIVGFGLLSGVPVTMGITGFVLAIGFIPPAILLKLWHGPQPQTVAEMVKSRE